MTEFKPFQQVLVRNSSTAIWRADLFSHTFESSVGMKENRTMTGHWNMVIPYEGNEHLVGTCENVEPEFSFGDLVEVCDLEGDAWEEAVYINEICLKGQNKSENCRFLYNVVKRGSSMVRGVKFCRHVKN